MTQTDQQSPPKPAIDADAVRPQPPSRSTLPGQITRSKLIGLVVLVFAASVLLVPRGVELAFLLVRSGHFDRALPLLERAFAGGDHSAATIAALARARAHVGNPQGSIDLLRGLVEARPTDFTALQLLADTYRDAHRAPEYRDALERLQQHVPSAERQRQLLRLYVQEGTLQQQMAALGSLIERFHAGEVADYLSLAALQQQHGSHVAALSTLDQMVRTYPQSLDASVVAAQMSALLAVGDTAAAMERGRSRLQGHPEGLIDEAPILAGVLGAAGRFDLQAELLDPYRAGPKSDARVIATWAQAMSDSGHPQRALEGLEGFDSAVGAGAELLRLKVGLALVTGRLDTAAGAARALGASRLPRALLTELAAAALAADRPDLLRFEELDVALSIGAHDPVLAARVALALGDQPAALRWSDAAMDSMPFDASRGIRLVRLLQQIGQGAKALEVLQTVPLRDATGSEIVEYARLSVALGHSAAGLELVDELRRRQPGDTIDQAWMLLATADRRYEQVLSWLNGAGSRVNSAQLLRDVLHLAMDGRAYGLAVATGQRLQRASGEDRDRLLLANALLAAGRAPEAVAWFRALRRSGLASDDAYTTALLAAWRQGAPVADELRGIFVDRLAHAGREAQREAAITTLLALGAHAQLLSTLEPLAMADPKRWLGVFAEAAAKAGQPGRLTEVWKRLAEADTTPAALRTQFAFRLLEAGEKHVAERVFRALAATASPGDTVTQRLLFVWGPRPKSDQLDWLQSRAAAASGDDRAAWMRLLIERGAALRAVDVYRKSASESDNIPVRDAYLDAVVAGGDKAALAGALRELAPRARSASQLARLAQRAVNAGDPALERRLLEAAIVAGDTDAKLHRTLGLLAYRMRDFAVAERNLDAFHQRDGGDVETHRAVGEIRLKQRDSASARRSFGNALEALERSGDHDFRSRLIKAALLHRLERTAESRKLYESLLAERPGDQNLRADYVAMLLDTGDAPTAQELLAAR